ncbi:hypothetical protein Cgig2_025478 [Carnegiea gigantea]|uniref:Uncharacterized protein n=1 Tax=Carnegiea gigantea TaxID=171969 RepID=A0A9Q1QDB6_9CARY|nr:hypothetical protein Cgig2_025478 [Carnegiea gigantea]
MMMKSLFKTLVKAPTLRPSTLSLSSNYWTSKFSSEQAVQPQAQGAPAMEDKNDTEDYNMKKWPVPSEIPFQSKVANWVNFIGTIRMPVQFVTLANGTSWAGTVLSQDCKSELRCLGSNFKAPRQFLQGIMHVEAVAHQTMDRLACQLWLNWIACLGLNRVEDS